MIPIYQTRASHEPGGGNCLAACLASILELKIEDLPDRKDYRFDSGDLDWSGYLKGNHEFLLSNFGLALLTVPLAESEDMEIENYVRRHASAYLDLAGYHLLFGETSRFPKGNILHAVVALNGQMVHDPHPDRAGLTKIRGFEVLVAHNPAKFVKKSFRSKT